MASKLTGDWSKVKTFTKKFPHTLKQSIDKAEVREAEDVKEALTKALLNQELTHVPLKPETVNKKGSNKILVDTGALANSFTVSNYGEGKVIYPEGTSESGLSMGELALIHEYGTQKIPARPFVQPVYTKVKEEVQNDIKEVVGNEIKKYT